MAQCLLHSLGGGLSKSRLEVITAGAGDVLTGKVIVDKNGNPLTGTMPNKGSWDCTVGIGASVTIPKGYHDGTGVAKNSTTNRGAWSGTVGVNGSVTIPEGYHNGSGKVTNSVATMSGQTITPSGSQQTVSCSGKYMTGNIVVKGAQIFKQYTATLANNMQATYSYTQKGVAHTRSFYCIKVTQGFTPVYAIAIAQDDYTDVTFLSTLNTWCVNPSASQATYAYDTQVAQFNASGVIIPLPKAGTYAVRIYGY